MASPTKASLALLLNLSGCWSKHKREHFLQKEPRPVVPAELSVRAEAALTAQERAQARAQRRRERWAQRWDDFCDAMALRWDRAFAPWKRRREARRRARLGRAALRFVRCRLGVQATGLGELALGAPVLEADGICLVYRSMGRIFEAGPYLQLLLPFGCPEHCVAGEIRDLADLAKALRQERELPTRPCACGVATATLVATAS
jgi:hypothetical protein